MRITKLNNFLGFIQFHFELKQNHQKCWCFFISAIFRLSSLYFEDILMNIRRSIANDVEIKIRRYVYFSGTRSSIRTIHH